LLIALVGIAAAWVLLVAAPLLPGLPPLLGTVVVSSLLAAASFTAICGLSGLRLRLWHEVGLMVLCGGLWYALSEIGVSPEAHIPLAATSSIVFMLACVMLGRLLSRLIREPNLLLPVLLTAAAVDIFTVSVGPTRLALEKAPEKVRSLSVDVPEAGSATGKQGAAGLTIAASIGLGDFIFAALFLTAAWRHRLELTRAAVAATLLTVLAMSAVLLLPQIPALPLLPFIVAGVLLPNLRYFRLSAQERVAMVVGALFLIVLLAVIYLVIHT